MTNISTMNWECPFCGKNHFSDTAGTSTLMYFSPIWKDGVNINPDRNATQFIRTCLVCGVSLSIAGNDADGYKIKEMIK